MKIAAVALIALAAQAAPAENRAVKPWGPIDNPRVHVWLDDGSTPSRDISAVAVVRISEADGRTSYSTDSSASATPQSTQSAAANSSPTIEIDVKQTRVAPVPDTSGYPLAFPRPGVKKVLESDRVIVWDYTWTAGQPTPMHFHDKDVVVVYLADGALRSTDPDGAAVVNTHYYGFTKFNARNRVHTEELVRGNARAIIVELK